MERKRGQGEAITVEIGCDRAAAWQALAGELDVRGGHVEVLAKEEPERLALRVRRGMGEEQLLEYSLVALTADTTAVTARIQTRGAGHMLKRLLSLGGIDRAYLDAVAVGLANLQEHLEGTSAAGGDEPPTERGEGA